MRGTNSMNAQVSTGLSCFSSVLAALCCTSMLSNLALAKDLDICSHPYETICQGTLAQAQSFRRKAVDDLKSRIMVSTLHQAALPRSKGGCGIQIDPKSDEWIDGYSWVENMQLAVTADKSSRLCYGRLLEKSIERQLIARKNISLKDVNRFFLDVRNRLANEVGKTSNLDPVLRSQMQNTVRSVTLITATNFSELARRQTDDATGQFIEQCGSTDLLNDNAYAAPPPYSIIAKEKDPETGHPTRIQIKEWGWRPVVLCPGRLIRLLEDTSTKPLNSLYRTFAHEISHFIHAELNWPYSDNFTRQEEASIPGSKNKKKLDVKYEYIGPNNLPLNRKAWARNYVPAYTEFSACLQAYYSKELNVDSRRSQSEAYLTQILRHTPSAVELHLAEVSADYWGGTVLASWLSEGEKSTDEIVYAIQRNTKSLCVSTATKENGIAPENLDDGRHASPRFRVEMILKNPLLRTLLGCKSSAEPEKPYCSL